MSLPAIAQSLHARFADVEWVISAYILTFAVMLLPAGAIADRHGRKRTVLAGLIIFGAASAGCGLTGSTTVLSISRAAQGIGGALLLTSSLAVIGHAFEAGPRRAGSAARGGRRRRAAPSPPGLRRPPSFAPASRWPPSSWSSA